MSGEDVVTVRLTRSETNRLATMLRDSAQDKKRRARAVHPNDRQDLLDAALADYELRKKIIAAKAAPEAVTS